MGSVSSKNKSKQPVNFINWFEIPVLDIHRAVEFYNHIYSMEMETSELNGYAMAFFPSEKGIGGALVKGPGCIPGETGPLIYLNAGKNLEAILKRVEQAMGKVLLGKTEIGDGRGYFGLFIDTEGNKLALHGKE